MEDIKVHPVFDPQCHKATASANSLRDRSVRFYTKQDVHDTIIWDLLLNKYRVAKHASMSHWDFKYHDNTLDTEIMTQQPL